MVTESLEAGRQAPVFTVMIPTWNNLPYLQACIRSIRKYSTYRHQLLVHVNEGNDGTADWLKTQPDIDFSFSRENIGVCRALNRLRTMAKTSYLLYMNDDMIVCPGWDKHLWNEVLSIGHSAFFLSATAIEPDPQSNCSIEADFGKTLDTFDEERLLREYSAFPMANWNGATWTPNLVHARYWDLVGGYSEAFSPGMYSDPDFSMKLWQQGVRIFKGVSASRVYHFGKISTGRIRHNPGYELFIRKWGMTSGTFSRRYLKRGTPYTGPLPEAGLDVWSRLKGYYKRKQLKAF
jgi:GT2 family glycosyltransferase